MNHLDECFFDNKKVLIIGASGYIANAVLSQLLNFDCEITRFSRRELAPMNGHKAKVKNQLVDYKNLSHFESDIKQADIIYFLAAQTSLYKAEDNPCMDLSDNLIPLISTLKICENNQHKPIFIYASTATVFGYKNKVQLDDYSPIDPSTIYDLNKSIGEQYISYYSKKSLLKGVTLRLANVYGPGTKESSNDRGVINFMAKRAVNGETLTIFGDGEFIRDYIYIEDVASAFNLSAEYADQLQGECFIISSGEGRTIKEAISKIALILEELSEKKVEILHVAPPEGLSPIEMRNFIGNSSRFKKITNWSPQFDYDKGIELTIRNFL
ncbi:MAG: NAD-dependent epimerase/dehydratase family protein [Halobacteriovoraceae bacterium]|nr:NAD-dependent epimerase/dehydratase family protein [Halobacteriovoraceae bacterium]